MRMTMMRRLLFSAGVMAVLLLPEHAQAQLDPLLYLKPRPGGVASGDRPTVLLAVDTSIRMQRDTNGDYRDPNQYKYAPPNLLWEDALGINSGVNVSTRLRRKYVTLTEPSNSPHGFTTDHIEIVGDLQADYARFDDYTRIAIARRGLLEAITRNISVARFGLIRTRQSNPRFLTPASADAWTLNINENPVTVSNAAFPLQQLNGDAGGNKWRITRAVVDAVNGSIGGPVAPLILGDANATLATFSTALNGLVPAGRDTDTSVDAPLDNMLDDLYNEAKRLLAADCRNIAAVLVVGGGEGTTTAENPAVKALNFLNVNSTGRRVPIHVIAIAPISVADRVQLRAIASNSGGQYTEITPDKVDVTNAGLARPVPEVVNAVNFAISHTFADEGDFNLPPNASNPYGVSTSQQVTSPIVGTVNLEEARDINGSPLPNTNVENPSTGTVIPQRSNVMITSGFVLPGFAMKMQAFRTYRPVVDTSKSVGYKFVSDGTKLWEASAPDAASRNIYTALPDGTVVAFTSANRTILRPYLRAVSDTEAGTIIDYIRSMPLGAIVDSTPAMMDPPSLDPPPDADYPGFADANKNRRSMIWVGANDGMLHGIDARLGKEVWAFIPFNLLPKVSALRHGQPVGDFRFYVDGSPKVADVKVGGNWRTYLVMGEGPGGTFYQTFDVTLPSMDSTVSPDSDDLSAVLSYFGSTTSVPLKWAFPLYSHFNWNAGQFGELAATATAVEKTVGETWSDPAIGQVSTPSSPYVVLTGSGFLKYSTQVSRGVTRAGTTFYVLDVATGAVYDSRDVGADGKGETLDNCVLDLVKGCTELKNAIQADPVATGPADSRFITKTYIGDLDGKVWRFDLNLNSSGLPTIQQMLNLYTISTGTGSKASDHPIFSSMATVSIGSTQQYLFVGTGSDLLPSNKISVQYGMFVILDQGSSGTQKALIKLEAVDGANGEEKVTSFPAVAGDIVFFSTTTYKTVACTKPDANLYAFTFIGGAAYDTNNDGKMNNTDTTKVRTTAGARATAPFIVDQHLVFGTGKSVETFGDPQDFNNGVGQAGVRILSWREVR
jgi:hypothetical protein